MAFNVNTNIAALRAVTAASRSGAQVGMSLTRLSTGLRINSAADDGVGLVVSEGLRAQVTGAKTARGITANAIAFLQTVDDSYGSVTNILQRLKDLSTQAASAGAGTASMSAISNESVQLLSELSRFSSQSFNGITFFGSGGTTSFSFFVGDGTIATASNFITVSVGGVSAGVTGGVSINASHFNIGANSIAAGGYTAGLQVNELDSAIRALTAARATPAASAARFQYAQTNLDSLIANVAAADSAIRDTDFAQETVNLTRAQILASAGISSVAAAFSLPQLALTLLGR